MATVLVNTIGISFGMRRDYDAARVFFERSLALCVQAGDQRGIAVAISNLGECAAAGGNLASARDLWQNSLTIHQTLREQRGILVALQNLGYLELQQGNVTRASTQFRQSLTIAQKLEDPRWIAEGLGALAWVAGSQSQPKRSLRLAAAAEACRDGLGVTERSGLVNWWTPGVELGPERMRALLGERSATFAWAEGWRLPREHAIAYALSESNAESLAGWTTPTRRPP